MIYTPALPAPTEYKLLKIVLDESENNLRMVDGDVVTIPTAPCKKPTLQQLIAAMAFRLLGLDALYLYNRGKVFMWPLNNLAKTTTEAFKTDAGAISHAAQIVRVFVHNNDVVKHGEGKENNVADYTSELTAVERDGDVVSFSKILGNKEIVMVHNTSETEPKEKFILLNNDINGKGKSLTAVYGYDACGQIHLFHGKQGDTDLSYIKIYLKPLHMVILKNY